jgi:sulfur-carrier protein adenylyltransferase/sulfurtransferase
MGEAEMVAKAEELTRAEIERYSRQLVLPELGEAGQQRLKGSSVIVVGAGGLGIPASVYLAAAGVGRIGIVDDDVVEKSNLHRQTMYSEEDVGMAKAHVAERELHEVNPHVSISAHQARLDSSNALQILKEYDVIVDCTDNFPARYLINDACVLLGKPDVYASIFRFDGQASVFDARKGPCYRCLFPEPPPPDTVQDCAVAGVLGVLPGIMGSIQAAQTINLLVGNGKPLVGRLLLFNASDMAFSEVRIGKNPDCPVCGKDPTVTKLIDYEEFCRGGRVETPVEEITPKALKNRLDAGSKIVLLDVREPFEYALCHIEGTTLIPMGELERKAGKLGVDKEVVVYCHTGVRSARAVNFLKSRGFKKAVNLKGGIDAWAEQIDHEMVRY